MIYKKHSPYSENYDIRPNNDTACRNISAPIPARTRHPCFTNGIEIIACNRGDEDVCRIDLMFEGGYYTETETGHSRPHLIDAQRKRCGQSSEEIAESFDYHGAWRKPPHRVTISMSRSTRSIGISIPAYLCWQTSLYDPISRKKNSPGSKNGVSNNCSFRKKK